MSQLEQTVSRYRSLRLSAAADELTNLLAEAEANEMSYLSFADRLAEHELIQRQDKRISRNRKMAAFPADKRLESFDYRHQTTINKRQVNALLDFQFIDERNNLVFIGPPGVGKTHLAIGIGHKAVEAGYRVLFRNALDLVEELELAEMKGGAEKAGQRLGQIRPVDHRRTGLSTHDPAGPVQPVPTDQQSVRIPVHHPDHQQGLYQLGRVLPRRQRGGADH